jgi:hypothetical protein
VYAVVRGADRFNFLSSMFKGQNKTAVSVSL